MNSVIRVDTDDAASSQLNESISSVIRVTTTPEKDAKLEGEDGEGDDDKGGKDFKLTRAQFEVLISDLKTKHLAEKRMMNCDLILCKKMVKLMVSCMRVQVKERSRNDIRLL